MEAEDLRQEYMKKLIFEPIPTRIPKEPEEGKDNVNLKNLLSPFSLELPSGSQGPQKTRRRI